MSSIPIILALLALSLAVPLPAQASDDAEELLKQSFSASFQIAPRDRLNNVIFESSSGQRYRGEIQNSEALGEVLAAEGARVLGSFRFRKLSGTDLGSSRLYAGSGILTFQQIQMSNGEPMGCPPLCERSVQLVVELQPAR